MLTIQKGKCLVSLSVNFDSSYIKIGPAKTIINLTDLFSLKRFNRSFSCLFICSTYPLKEK